MTFSLILRNGSALVVDCREVLSTDDEVFRGSVEQCLNEQDSIRQLSCPEITEAIQRGLPVLKPITTILLSAPRV